MMLERSIKYAENRQKLIDNINKRCVVRDKETDELLYLGTIENTTLRKLDDWPEDLIILPTDDIPRLESVLKMFDGKNVKIGANDGVGFLYAGPGLFGFLKSKSDMVLAGIIAKIEQCEKDIYNFEHDFWISYVNGRNYARRKNGLPLLTKKDLEFTKEHQLANIKNRLYRYELKRDKFTNTLDCGVTDIYQSVSHDELGTYIIMFDGSSLAQGTFWTIKECAADLRIKRIIEMMEETE